MQNRKPVSLIYFGDSHGFIKGQKELGGFAKIATVVKRFQEENPNNLFFYGGDLLGPTEFTREYRGEVDAKLLENMHVDAFTIGNHDLHKGPQGLRNIIDWTGPSTQFLAANLDSSQEPLLKGKIHPSAIFEKGDQRIAVIGATTEESKTYPKEHLGELQFTNLVDSIKEQMRDVKKHGADLIILLSHLGYKKDQELAPLLLEEGHDLVILGNHTHTNLGLPEKEFGASKGAYPTEISAHGHKAFITAASYYGQAVGTLQVTFSTNELGQTIIQECSGVPIVIEASIQNDPDAEKIIAAYPLKSDLVTDPVVAHTDVDLIGLESFSHAKMLEDIIRREEAPITNFVADIVCEHAKQEVTDTSFALIHAGGVRSDLPAGDITENQIKKTLPYEHFIRVLPLTAKQIKQALEEGVHKDHYRDGRGNFLIGSSSLRYTYDIEKPRGERITNITFEGEALDEDKIYQVAINSYMLGMKLPDTQAPTVFASVGQMIKLQQTDCEAVLQYCRERKPSISGRLDGRIHCAQGSLLNQHGSTAAPEDLYIDVISKLSAREQKQEVEASTSTPSVQVPGTLFFVAGGETATETPQPTTPRIGGS